MLMLLVYRDEAGREPFSDWFDGLDAAAADKVSTAMQRLTAGSLSDTKSVGRGVLERRIDWGPGYRLYFGRDGATIVILLAGGTKRHQGDIAAAQARWADYKRRTRTGGGM